MMSAITYLTLGALLGAIAGAKKRLKAYFFLVAALLTFMGRCESRLPWRAPGLRT